MLTIENELVAEFARSVEQADHIIVGTHLNPDGDALGSAISMGLYLDSLGKSFEVLCHHAAPRNLRFLPFVDRIRTEGTEKKADLGIILDLDSTERLGNHKERFDAVPKLIVVDHHVPHQAPGDVRIVNTSAAATAELLTKLYLQLGAPISPDMATCLYTGIVTDTGSFRFRNTSPSALQAAATLLERGAAFEKVSEEVFQSRQLSSARLLGHTLETMKLDMNDKLAWGVLSHRDFTWANAKDEDTEGFVNELLSIETVQVAALFREAVPGKIRVSVRSRGTIDVAEVTRKFGGGGHKNAAGCNFETSLEEAERRLVSELRLCLESV